MQVDVTHRCIQRRAGLCEGGSVVPRELAFVSVSRQWCPLSTNASFSRWVIEETGALQRCDSVIFGRDMKLWRLWYLFYRHTRIYALFISLPQQGVHQLEHTSESPGSLTGHKPKNFWLSGMGMQFKNLHFSKLPRICWRCLSGKHHFETHWSAIDTMTLILAVPWNHLGNKQAKIM